MTREVYMALMDQLSYQSFNWDWSFLERQDSMVSRCIRDVCDLHGIKLETSDDETGIHVVTGTAGYANLNDCLLTTQLSMSILCFLPLPPQIKPNFISEHITSRRRELFQGATDDLNVRVDICSRVSRPSFSIAKDELVRIGKTSLRPFDLFNFSRRSR